MANASCVEVPHRRVCRERGWDLTFSRRGIGFRMFSYLEEDGRPAASRQRAGPRIASPKRRLWLVPLLLGSGSIAAGVLAAPATPAAHPYSVTVPVPARPAPAARRSAKPPVRQLRQARQEQETRVTIHVLEDASSTPSEPTDDPPVTGTSEARERRFTSVAMRTGEMQSWQSDGVHYYLVAGDLRRTTEGSCRAFSLLARPEDGGDSVRHFERCRSTG